MCSVLCLTPLPHTNNPHLLPSSACAAGACDGPHGCVHGAGHAVGCCERHTSNSVHHIFFHQGLGPALVMPCGTNYGAHSGHRSVTWGSPIVEGLQIGMKLRLTGCISNHCVHQTSELYSWVQHGRRSTCSMQQPVDYIQVGLVVHADVPVAVWAACCLLQLPFGACGCWCQMR